MAASTNQSPDGVFLIEETPTANRRGERERSEREREKRGVVSEITARGRRGQTHVDHVRDVVDVVLGHHGVGRRQVQQVVVPSFGAFEFVLRVLGLPLRWEEEEGEVGREGREEAEGR